VFSRNFCRSAINNQVDGRKTNPLADAQSSSSSQREGASNIVRSGEKPPTNEPFVKNLFVGKFDTKMLIFPEILTKDGVEELNQMVEPIEKFFTQEIDSAAIDRNSKIPDEVFQQLKDFGLFGQVIPTEYGGLGFTATQLARMAEVTTLDPSIHVTLNAHQAIGLKGILLQGTDQQKAKYLPKLATGEHIAAFCLTESGSGSDAASIKTYATLSEDGKTYFLNGEKLWISNGGIAQIMTVFAKTKVTKPTGETEDKVTAFIVERAFGGVTSGKPEDKMGIRGSNTCALHFDNTPVPAENVIGGVGQGFKVAMNILNSGRFSIGCASAGALRSVLNLTTQHAIQRKQFGRSLKEFGLIQEKIAKIALDVYVMESMAYIVAAHMDSIQNPDVALESAAIKIFSTEAVWSCLSECLQIFGGLGYMRAYPLERYVRDSRITMIFEGTNEILRLLIALTGLQHAGRELKDVVRRLRDPLNNVGFVFNKAVERFKTNRSNPSLQLALYDHVHPDLSHCGELLEVRIVKYKYMVEKYLSTYADKIVEEQLALKRFADIAVDFFAVTSVLARASRSKAIGLQNCDHEVLLARTFTCQACKRIDNNLQELDEGRHENGDDNVIKIAETIFKNGGWTSQHPLLRNW